MRRIASLLLSFVIIFVLTACSKPAASEKQETEEQMNMEMEPGLLESVSTQQEADLDCIKGTGGGIFIIDSYKPG